MQNRFHFGSGFFMSIKSVMFTWIYQSQTEKQGYLCGRTNNHFSYCLTYK